MDITVRRRGGFAGVNERLGPVDTGTLDSDLSAELESVVRDVGFFDLPSSFPPGSGADLFEFTATVVDGARCHTASWDDLSDRPPQLDRIVELLLQAGATWEPPVGAGGGAGNPLFQPWIHSREEDSGQVEVYRPEGFDFPPSFGRDGFTVHPDGRYTRRDIGPADGTVDVPGRWMARVLDVTFHSSGEAPATVELISYDSERLTRKPVAGEPGDGGGHAWQPLDFESAEILTLESEPPQYVLAVRGTKPFFNMDVRLVPRVYVRRPEYWGIEVVGCADGLVLPAEAPYSVTLPLASVTGTKGVEVVGATRSEKLDVPPGSAPSLPCGGWSAFVDRQPPGPPKLIVVGRCTFPTAGFTVALTRHEPQGINPKDLLLDLTVTEPTGPVAQVVTEVEARYEEEPPGSDYETVTILPDGATVPVEEVH